MSNEWWLPDATTFLTLGFIGFLVLCGWLLWRQNHDRKPINPTAILLTGVAGILLAGSSFFLSVSYGFSIGGDNLALSLVFATVLGAISISEFLAAYWLEEWLRAKLAVLYIFSGIVLVLGVGTSIIAGQALIASKIDEIKAARLQASESYQSAIAQRDLARQKANDLAVSLAEYQPAQNQKAQAMNAARSIIASAHSSWMDCSSFPNHLCIPNGNYKTKTDQINARLTPHYQIIQQAERVIAQFHKYQAAKQYANELQAQPLPASTGIALPHVKWLATVTGADPDTLEAKLYITLAFIGEGFGLLMLFFYGKKRREDDDNRLASLKPAVVGEVPMLDGGGMIFQDGLAILHAGEMVLTKEETSAYLAQRPVVNTTSTTQSPAVNTTQTTQPVGVVNTTGKKESKYQPRVCANPDCTVEFTPRQWNHKYCCDECRARGNGYQSVNYVRTQLAHKNLKGG